MFGRQRNIGDEKKIPHLIGSLIIILHLAVVILFSTSTECLSSDPCSIYYGNGYCTDYVGHRLGEGYRQGGNAGTWSGNIDSSDVRYNDVAIFNSPGVGHVAVVDSVNGESVTISEWNWGAGWIDENCSVTTKFGILNTRTISMSDVDRFWRHTYRKENVENVACMYRNTGSELCWNYNDVNSWDNCEQGSGHFVDNQFESVCYLVDDSYCIGGSSWTSPDPGKGGGQSEPDPDEEPKSGLPNFVTPKSWLSPDGGSTEKYYYQPGEKAYACSITKNIGEADSPSDIKVMFLLSDGYKEDAHSDWEQVGDLQNIRDYNLEIGESKKECTDFNVPNDPGIYNIVACADRTVTSGNGDGDVEEMHKSDNCSTEAVFSVTIPNELPEGSLDAATCDNFTGWTKDPNTTSSISVHFYADGPAGTGTYLGSTPADIYRSDLSYVDKNHGFSFAFSKSLKDGIEHQIYAYGIDDRGETNPLLTNSPKSIKCGLTRQQKMAILSIILMDDDGKDGDINQDGKVDLADAILVLQVITGKTPTNISKGADINRDNKLGLQEVMYILRKMSEQ